MRHTRHSTILFGKQQSTSQKLIRSPASVKGELRRASFSKSKHTKTRKAALDSKWIDSHYKWACLYTAQFVAKAFPLESRVIFPCPSTWGVHNDAWNYQFAIARGLRGRLLRFMARAVKTLCEKLMRTIIWRTQVINIHRVRMLARPNIPLVGNKNTITFN